MSCRVLKRGMENFTLHTIVDYAKEHGFRHIIGEYLPTAKNKMVEEHYLRLGFVPMENAVTSRFKLDVETYMKREFYITKK